MARETVIGLAIRQHAVDWAVGRWARGAGDGQDRGRVDVAPVEGGPQSVAQAVRADPSAVAAALKAGMPRLRGAATVGLPSDQLMLRVLALPAAPPAEMREMVALQMDKFAPFPLDTMVVSHEILAETEGQVRVLAAAVQRALVEPLGKAVSEAGLQARRVDANVLAWLQLVRDGGGLPGAGLHVLVLMDAPECELVVLQDGVPVLLRAFGGLEQLSDEETAAEIGYTLTSMQVQRGALAQASVSVRHSGEAPLRLVEALRGQYGLKVDSGPLADLPPLAEGLASRAAGARAATLNLAPAEWGGREQARKTRRRIVAASVAAGMVWLAGVSLLFGSIRVETARKERQDAHLARIRKPAEEVQNVMRRTRALRAYGDRTHSALECLRETSAILPEGIDLTSFTYKKGRNVVVTGDAASATRVYDFKNALDKSAMFKTVELGNVVNVPQTRRVRFTVTIAMPGGEGAK